MQYEHTCQHRVNCIKAQGAMRIFKIAAMPATKATEHPAISVLKRVFGVGVVARGSLGRWDSHGAEEHQGARRYEVLFSCETRHLATRQMPVLLKSASKVHLSSECARPRKSFTQKCARDFRMSQYTCCLISMSICVSWSNWQVKWAISLLMPCVTRTVMNSRKSWILYRVCLMRNLKIVLMRLMRLFTEKESIVTTAFSWSNVSSQNRGGATKRSKIDNSVLLDDSNKIFSRCLLLTLPQ